MKTVVSEYVQVTASEKVAVRLISFPFAGKTTSINVCDDVKPTAETEAIPSPVKSNVPIPGEPSKVTVISAVNISSVKIVWVLLSSHASIFDAVIAVISQAETTSIIASAVVHIVAFGAFKQISYVTVYVPGILPSRIFSVPSEFIVTPVKPPLLVIPILSLILPSLASEPSDKSVPFPLSSNILPVIPPNVASIGIPLKLSFRAKIVGWKPQSSTVPDIIHSNVLPVPVVRPPVLPLVICPTKQIEPPPALLKKVVAWPPTLT